MKEEPDLEDLVQPEWIEALVGTSDLPSGALDEVAALLRRNLAAEGGHTVRAAARLQHQAKWRTCFGVPTEARAPCKCTGCCHGCIWSAGGNGAHRHGIPPASPFCRPALQDEVPTEIAAGKVLVQPPPPLHSTAAGIDGDPSSCQRGAEGVQSLRWQQHRAVEQQQSAQQRRRQAEAPRGVAQGCPLVVVSVRKHFSGDSLDELEVREQKRHELPFTALQQWQRWLAIRGLGPCQAPHGAQAADTPCRCAAPWFACFIPCVVLLGASLWAVIQAAPSVRLWPCAPLHRAALCCAGAGHGLPLRRGRPRWAAGRAV